MGAFEAMDEPGISKEEGQMRSAENVAAMVNELPRESESTQKDPVAAETKADAKIAEAIPQDVSNVKDLDGGAFAVPASGTRGQMARSQSFDKPKEAEGRGMSGIFVLMLIGCAVAGAVAMSNAVQADKGTGKDQEMSSMVSPVSLGVKPKAPPAALPAGLQEVDVLETFDSFDKKRRGFIDADVLEGLLGPDEAAHKAAAKVVGNMDRLFYHDFRKLVLQEGPVQDKVLNMASRKRGAPIELGKA
jgi:hypothetical protein